MGSLKLTARLLDKLKAGERVFDTEVHGLFAEKGQSESGAVKFRYKTSLREGPRTGAARKPRPFKRTLGAFPKMTLEEARNEAAKLRSTVRSGRDPREGTVYARGMWTVSKLKAEYIKDRKHQKKIVARTIADLEKRYAEYLDTDITYETTDDEGEPIEKSQSAWGALPLAAITPEVARARHLGIATNHGPVVANDSLRNFRAMFNWALNKQPHLNLTRNPVSAVTFVTQPDRTESLKLPDLPDWLQRLKTVENRLRRLMHLATLFCGMRPGALAQAERSWLLLDQSVMIVPSDVMKKRKEFHLPLSRYLVAIFKRTLDVSELLFPGALYLYPTRANKDRTGPIKATVVWAEDNLKGDYGYKLRHYYSNVCQAASVVSTNRMLLMAQKIPGIEGTYLNNPFLFKTLLSEQEKATAYLLKRLGLKKGVVDI